MPINLAPKDCSIALTTYRTLGESIYIFHHQEKTHWQLVIERQDKKHDLAVLDEERAM